VRRPATGLLVSLLALAGCGSRTPPISDYGDEAKTQELIHAIVHSVHCEIFNAVGSVIPDSWKAPDEFLEDWGAEVLLTLQIDEITALNPNGVWSIPLTPPNFFTFGFGGAISQHATRIEKLNFFYSVDEIQALKKNHMSCTVPPNPGSMLVQSDLGLRQWLQAEYIGIKTEEFRIPTQADSVFKQNVLQHEIKFDLLASGNITPGFKIVNVNVNQTGSLFSTSRERVHDLLITLGPIDKNAVTGLIASAENAHLASQISARLSTTP
jgi:hypothetical protein